MPPPDGPNGEPQLENNAMRTIVRLGLMLGALTLADSAAAHGKVSCDVPAAERRPQADLRADLERQGWTVRKIEVSKGCYEVYGRDANGAKVEAFFNPKTFERVRAN
jgi:hypothetical protein